MTIISADTLRDETQKAKDREAAERRERKEKEARATIRRAEEVAKEILSGWFTEENMLACARAGDNCVKSDIYKRSLYEQSAVEVSHVEKLLSKKFPESAGFTISIDWWGTDYEGGDDSAPTAMCTRYILSWEKPQV